MTVTADLLSERVDRLLEDHDLATTPAGVLRGTQLGLGLRLASGR